MISVYLYISFFRFLFFVFIKGFKFFDLGMLKELFYGFLYYIDVIFWFLRGLLINNSK